MKFVLAGDPKICIRTLKSLEAGLTSQSFSDKSSTARNVDISKWEPLRIREAAKSPTTVFLIPRQNTGTEYFLCNSSSGLCIRAVGPVHQNVGLKAPASNLSALVVFQLIKDRFERHN